MHFQGVTLPLFYITSRERIIFLLYLFGARSNDMENNMYNKFIFKPLYFMCAANLLCVYWFCIKICCLKICALIVCVCVYKENLKKGYMHILNWKVNILYCIIYFIFRIVRKCWCIYFKGINKRHREKRQCSSMTCIFI